MFCQYPHLSARRYCSEPEVTHLSRNLPAGRRIRVPISNEGINKQSFSEETTVVETTIPVGSAIHLLLGILGLCTLRVFRFISGELRFQGSAEAYKIDPNKALDINA